MVPTGHLRALIQAGLAHNPRSSILHASQVTDRKTKSQQKEQVPLKPCLMAWAGQHRERGTNSLWLSSLLTRK